MNEEIKAKFLEMGKKFGLSEELLSKIESELTPTGDEMPEGERVPKTEGEDMPKGEDMPGKVIAKVTIKKVAPDKVDSMTEDEAKNLLKTMLADGEPTIEAPKKKSLSDILASRVM